MVSSTPLGTLSVRFGPLQYAINAYDECSEALLSLIQQQLDVTSSPGQPDRLIHLLTYKMTPEDFEFIGASTLPPRLAAITPVTLPSTGWLWSADELGYAGCRHPKTVHGFWTYDAERANTLAVYQIPWEFFTPDLCQRPGGIFHGGLAVCNDRGYLFTAPPGGGKSTALSRFPQPWEVLSDDAALVWFDREGTLWASPLPTWSALMGRGSMLPAEHRPRVAAMMPVAGIVLLEKSSREHVVSVRAIDAVAELYRALREHPAALRQRSFLNALLFHCACAMARTTPIWRLELTRHGPFWETLAKAL